MNMYSYGYLMHSSNIANDIIGFLAILLAISFIYYGFKYFGNHRTKLRYRNVLIAILAFSALLICVQFGKLQDINSTKSQIGQTEQVMKNISHNKHINIKHIYSSSSNFTNGMMVKAGSRFYTVNSNSDNSAYYLHKAIPSSNQINYVKHQNKLGINFHLNFNNDKNLNIALKLLIGFILFMVQINLLGKGNLAPSSSAQQCENYILGGIIGGIMYNPAITFLQFIIIILIWSVIVFTFKVIADNSNLVKNFFEGEPHIIINDGHIDVDTALKAGLTANDIIFKLRSAGVKDYSNVKRVTLEQNGQFSIDSVNDKNINYPVIADGKIVQNTLKQMGKNGKWIKNLLKLKHHHIKDVFLGQIVDGQLNLTLYPTNNIRLTKFEPKKSINLKTLKHKIIPYTEKIKEEVNKYRRNHNSHNS